MWECGKCGALSEIPLVICESCGEGQMKQIGLSQSERQADSVCKPSNIAPSRKPAAPVRVRAWKVKLCVAIVTLLVFYFLGTYDPYPDVVVKHTSAKGLDGSVADCGSDDATCLAEQARASALPPCMDRIQNRAQYAYRWTNSVFGKPVFEHDYMWGIPPDVIVYSGSAMEAQNGFGAWKEMYYQCWYNVRTSQIERVVLR
ncbi:hypothetical protein IIDPJIOB_04231 [Aeromonas veronii]